MTFFAEITAIMSAAEDCTHGLVGSKMAAIEMITKAVEMSIR